MKKIVKIHSLILLFLGLAFLLTACNWQQKIEEKPTVRVAFFPNLTHSQALVGKDKGIFQKALGKEIKVEWKKFNSGPAELEALLTGAVDIGYLGPGPAINGYSKSQGQLQIIAGATDQGSVLVSRPGLLIKDLKELEGKRIAIPQYGNTQDLLLRALLQQAGLRETSRGGTVDIRQAENPDIKTLLGNGQLDAALVPEPWGSRLLQEVQANLVLDFNQIWPTGNYSSAVVVVRTEFLKEHPELVEKWLKAHVELTQWINQYPGESKEVVNRQLEELTKKKLSPAVLDMAWRKLVVTYNPETSSIKSFVQVSLDIGNLKGKQDISQLFNLQPLNKVLKQQGKGEIN